MVEHYGSTDARETSIRRAGVAAPRVEAGPPIVKMLPVGAVSPSAWLSAAMAPAGRSARATGRRPRPRGFGGVGEGRDRRDDDAVDVMLGDAHPVADPDEALAPIAKAEAHGRRSPRRR